MKRFLYILGAGLCVLVVLSALLFIQAHRRQSGHQL